MWIGVFDSGLGGLAIAEAIRCRLPQYNYLYLGDTKRVPYGNRSQETIHQFVSEALNFLFLNDCRLVILACNTASAEALRKTQQEYLPRYYPERRILGVVIPAVECAMEGRRGNRVGVLATAGTVESGAYLREFARASSEVQVYQIAAPLLVPVIENDGLKYLDPMLDDYLKDLLEIPVSTLVLGCTHYALIKEQVRAKTNAYVVSPDEIVPDKLADYLKRHPEMDRCLSKGQKVRYCVTDATPAYLAFAERLVGRPLQLERVEIS